MVAPTGALVTTSGYPIIDPDTINPRDDWPGIQQAQADWLDTHAILTFATYAQLLIARPTMPPGESGYAFISDTRTLWQWSGSAWTLAVPWTQVGVAGMGGAIAAGGSLAGDVTITFPFPFPSAAGYTPAVVTSFQAARCSLSVVARSASSMQIRVNNFTSAASDAGATLYWSATHKAGA